VGNKVGRDIPVEREMIGGVVGPMLKLMEGKLEFDGRGIPGGRVHEMFCVLTICESPSNATPSLINMTGFFSSQLMEE